MLRFVPFLQVSFEDLLTATTNDLVEGFLKLLPYAVIGLVVFGVFLIIARIARGIIIQVGERTRLDVTLARILGSIASFAVTLLGILVAAVIVFPTFSPGNLITGLGITSVAIGFAFKDILQNVFAGLLILWRKPFRIGDEVQSQEYAGTVEEINVRSTRIRTYDNEVAVIPNATIFTNPVLVSTAYHKRRSRFSVGIGYPDSIEEARRIIHDVLARTDGILKEPGPWVYVSELAPSQVNFTVYFWTSPDQAEVLRISDRVATSIKLALDEAGIDIPFPHTVVHFNDPLDLRENGATRRMGRNAQPAGERRTPR